MKDELNLKIITPEKEIYNSKVKSFKGENISGKFGILSDHVPMVTVLKDGTAEIEEVNKKVIVSISNGMLRLKNNEINILCDKASFEEENK